MKKEIAIIGISVKITDIDGMEAFWKFVEKGAPGFHRLPELRQKDIFDRFGAFEIAAGSYLERIDLFDNEFFGIMPSEAERMDPEQRLMLECAVKTIFNAGYTVDELKGQRIGIYHTLSGAGYRRFFDDSTNVSIAAHMPAMVGTRIARFMDWRGPVLGIDTTCSSSLTGLYSACQSIANGDCTMAFVGGATLTVTSKEVAMKSPVISKKGHCLPFDNAADGTLAGEGVIGILVKSLENAVRDGDVIYAVIKGGAINHGGALIQNISAPSPAAQADVIRTAWANSAIRPKDIRFVEAHGTGTILGDPIEFGGLVSAFQGITDRERKCSISSIKGQIGHLGGIAGLAGLIRLVASIRNKKLLPQCGFSRINDEINEHISPVCVQRKVEDWVSEGPRTGGVSSFGLTGTNVHMVIQEYGGMPVIQKAGDSDVVFMAIVGASAEVSANNVRNYLITYLKNNPDVDLGRLSYSLNKLLSGYSHTESLTFRNAAELSEKLGHMTFSARNTRKKGKIYLLIPGVLGQDLKRHCSTVKLMMEAGFSPDKILGAQGGKAVASLLSGTGQTKDGLESFDASGFTRFMDSIVKEDGQVFAMGKEGKMIDVLRDWMDKNDITHLKIVIPDDEYTVTEDLLSAYYNMGNELDLVRWFGKNYILNDLHLPLLSPKRFWPVVTSLINTQDAWKQQSDSPPGMTNAKKSGDENIHANELPDIQQIVIDIWKGKVKAEIIGLDDDFFDLGGTSLMGLDVLQSIEKRFGINLEYPDIFDYSTIRLQADLVYNKTQERRAVKEKAEDRQAGYVGIDTSRREADYRDLVENIKGFGIAQAGHCKRILLTGGTGFLGAYILKELLVSTSAVICCLVRASCDDEARNRVIKMMGSYFPGEPLDCHRLIGIAGDIIIPGLDLSDNARKLLGPVDSVYHLAANVSHFGKVETINSANFDGTVNLLEWSKGAGVNTFNHFSTISIANGGSIDGIDNVEFYESDLDLGQRFTRRIYSDSKFRAELYIRSHKEGLNVNVYRIGNVGGDSRTGLFQHNIDSNGFYQRLKTLAGLPYYCDEIAQYSFETTPVDIVAKTVVQLSLCKNENLLTTFHITEPEPIRLHQMVKQLETNNIVLEKTDSSNFFKYIDELSTKNGMTEDNLFLGIVRYGVKGSGHTKFSIRQEATRAYLDRIECSFSYDKDAYANTLIKYCIQRGFILRSA